MELDLAAAVVVGIVAIAVIRALVALAVVLGLGPSSGPARDVTVDLKVNVNTPEYYWAPVHAAEPLTPEEYKEVAKSIGDEYFRRRFGHVHIFDDEWA